jgi:hypothetical protein
MRKTAILSCLGAIVATTAFSNGIGEGNTWKFQTSTDTLNRANVASLIEKAQAGYGPGDTNINYDIAGDMVNCNLNSTAVGNTGTNGQDAPIGSPTVGLDSSVDAGSTGNTSANTAQGGTANSDTMNGGQVDSALGVGETITQNPTTSTALNSDQANAGSQLSTIGAVDNEYAVAGVAGNGGSAQANLNSTQTMANTTLTSQVQGSNACDFQTISGNLASPINAVSPESNSVGNGIVNAP